MELSVHKGIREISPDEWKALERADYPFTDYAHLKALEDSGCVGAEAGWLPVHLVARGPEGIAGAMFLYVKDNSYGEFIFDHPWAAAYQRAGVRYYPKLVSAVPFTPATGPRILTAPGADVHAVQALLSQGALQLARAFGCSSLHVLFLPETEKGVYLAAGLLPRKSLQYHWRNRGYRSFEDFTTALTGKRRRQVQQERRQLLEEGLVFETITGAALTEEHADFMHTLYLDTHAKRRSPPVLNQAFFRQVFREMPAEALLFTAKRGETPIAAALNFAKGPHMYGRYWGALEEVRHLHFELCYYRPIEHAIASGMALYEAGAQGEHKIPRGFVPSLTHSAHEIFHPAFRPAITAWLDEEARAVEEEIEAWKPHLPYKDDQ